MMEKTVESADNGELMSKVDIVIEKTIKQEVRRREKKRYLNMQILT